MNSFKQVYFYQQQANTSSGKGSRRLPTESVDNPVRYLIISLSKPCGSRGTKNQRKNIAKLKHIKIKWLNFMMLVIDRILSDNSLFQIEKWPHL